MVLCFGVGVLYRLVCTFVKDYLEQGMPVELFMLRELNGLIQVQKLQYTLRPPVASFTSKICMSSLSLVY